MARPGRGRPMRNAEGQWGGPPESEAHTLGQASAEVSRPGPSGRSIRPPGTDCRECDVEHERCACGEPVAVVWLLSWEPHSLELHQCRA